MLAKENQMLAERNKLLEDEYKSIDNDTSGLVRTTNSFNVIQNNQNQTLQAELNLFSVDEVDEINQDPNDDPLHFTYRLSSRQRQKHRNSIFKTIEDHFDE